MATSNQDTLRIKCFLLVNSTGQVRVTKHRALVKADEISMGLNLELPRSLFRKPTLSATLIVPESAGNPESIPVEVQDTVRDAIVASTGLQVRLMVEDLST